MMSHPLKEYLGVRCVTFRIATRMLMLRDMSVICASIFENIYFDLSNELLLYSATMDRVFKLYISCAMEPNVFTNLS